MKHIILILLVILYASGSATAQNKTYFGFEFAVSNDLFKITDSGDHLISVPLYNVIGGFNLRQEINKHIFIETGVILKPYQQGFGFKTIPYYTSTSSESSWLIPLRFGLNVNLHKEKMYLVPIIGYTFGINPQSGISGHGTAISSTTTINYNYTGSSYSSPHFSLLQTGVGFEFKISNTLLFAISGNYYIGFNKITQLDIIYSVNNDAPVSGTAVSKGEFWCVSTGLKYPISNFWNRD